jgi:hypothetical protein
VPLLSDAKLPAVSRLKGRNRRTVSVSTKLTSEEFDSIVHASQNSGKAIGEWAREVLLKEAAGASGTLSNEDLLVELVGVHLLLMNALAPVIRGETMGADWYNNLLRQVRESKQEAAKVVIARRLADRNKTKGIPG